MRLTYYSALASPLRLGDEPAVSGRGSAEACTSFTWYVKPNVAQRRVYIPRNKLQ